MNTGLNKGLAAELTAAERHILQRAFGWHAVPWADAFSEALRHLGARPSMVLEIGASGRSAPSMFFLNKGASVEVTCHLDEELRDLKIFCECFCMEHHLPAPVVRTRDIFSPSADAYDVIVLKGVLGGLDRKHDLAVFSRAIDCCRGMLRPNGHLIVMDKGWCSRLHNAFLRRFGSAGRNGWHYFSHGELQSLSGQCQGPQIVWKGFLSVGVMPFKWLQRFADTLDRNLFNVFLAQRGTVFAAVYRNGEERRWE